MTEHDMNFVREDAAGQGALQQALNTPPTPYSQLTSFRGP